LESDYRNSFIRDSQKFKLPREISQNKNKEISLNLEDSPFFTPAEPIGEPPTNNSLEEDIQILGVIQKKDDPS